MTTPTMALYGALQAAFDHFNSKLFRGKLKPCLITLRSANRVCGYHHAQRFVSPTGEKIDELGLHPGYFSVQPVEVVLSTLVHEMVHHWQEEFGMPTPSNPHNKEWSEKAESIGLMPSHNGLPGGRRTGRSMSHYILPDGKFNAVCRKFVDTGFDLPWLDTHSIMTLEEVVGIQQALEIAGVRAQVTPPPYLSLPVT